MIEIHDRVWSIPSDELKIGNQGETEVEQLQIKIDRYTDSGLDLSRCTLYVVYVNANGDDGRFVVYTSSKTSDSITFYWDVSSGATSIAGQLKVIIFAGITSSSEYTNIWKSDIATFTVGESLDLPGSTVTETQLTDSLAQALAKIAEARDEAVEEIQESESENVKGVITTALPTTGADNTDYYVKNAKGVYEHYRWIDSKWETVGTVVDAYTKSEVDTLVNQAKSAASTAQSTADTAKSNAATAQSTADTAKSNAATAQSAAETAQKTAEDNYKTLNSKIGAQDTTISAAQTSADNAAKSASTNAKNIMTLQQNRVTDRGDIDELIDTLSGYDTKVQAAKDTADEAYKTANDVSTKVDGYDETISDLQTTDTGLRKDVDANTGDIGELRTAIQSHNTSIEGLQSSIQNLKVEGDAYDCKYDSNNGDFEFQKNGETITKFTIIGGSGGSSTSSTIALDKLTASPYAVVEGSKVQLIVNFTSKDSTGTSVDATYTLKVGTTQVASGLMLQGKNTFDVTEYCTVGQQKVYLSVIDDYGSIASTSWNVNIVSIRLESTFNDGKTLTTGKACSFTYTPYGSVSKTIHFKMDGVELGTYTTSASGVLQTYSIPAQTRGAHLLEVWITANVSSQTVESDHLYKDIIWYDTESTNPVIGCIYRSDYYGEVSIRQYDTLSITFNVFDPSTATPTISRSLNGARLGEDKLNGNTYVWNYKSSTVSGENPDTLIFKCGTSSVTVLVRVEELGIDVTPITTNLEVDFNPDGYTNTSATRLWSNTNYKMTVSSNFDWSNGGYKTDDNGYTYFSIKSGTRAYIDYKMFTGNSDSNVSDNGTEIKIIFMTENVQSENASWLSNYSASDDVGIKLNAHNGAFRCAGTSTTMYDDDGKEISLAESNEYLYIPYCEEDRIELDINVDAYIEGTSDSFAMAYEDGVPSKAFSYNSTHHKLMFQKSPEMIEIGSDECDVRLYRLKIYSNTLTSESIMRNFIADSLDSDTMLSRYDRNSIYYNSDTGTFSPYSSEGSLDPDKLASALPNIKILKLDAPTFTTSKTDFIKYSNLECIHKNGDPFEDNWKFFNGYHAGQGTTSNKYGKSGRNVDFLFNADGQRYCTAAGKENDGENRYVFDKNYVSYLIKGYNTESAVTYTCTNAHDPNNKARIGLTDTSVPTNFLNMKVNVASSENANNALLQKRLNDYMIYNAHPYPSINSRSGIGTVVPKNDMEFVPAILFIRENSETATHTEFNDTKWHFYAIGNVGDSKKTDFTRAYDPDDMNEFTIEISDNTGNNSTFQSGVYLDSSGAEVVESVNDSEKHHHVYPIALSKWNSSNKRYYHLYNNWGDSFEFRYACGGDYQDGKFVCGQDLIRTKSSDATQIALNEDVWRAFYRFIVTSTDSEFKAQLEEWVSADAMEFFYAYTSHWTMMDNRAKNTFWHFAKSDTFRQITNPVSEMLHVYCERSGEAGSYTYTKTTDTSIVSGKTYWCQYVFDLWDYDNDTSLGINNNGELIFPYGKEDIDYQVDGDPTSDWIYNGAESTFWCRLRDLMPDDIRSAYVQAGTDCWSPTHLINEFDNYQSSYPEEMWRLDIERKYLRPFYGTSIDNSIPKFDQSYLRDMMQGRKKYQRRQWVRDQYYYFGTKFRAAALDDDDSIRFRCKTPQTTVVVSPNYTLKVTPYSDMYLTIKFGNANLSSDIISSIRAKSGVEYTLEKPSSVSDMNDTQVTIFAGSRISALNDLSAFYIRTNNFDTASKLKKLVLGNSKSGYNNSFLTSLSLNNNPLLEELDIRNLGSLTSILDLSGSPNLKKLYAEGSSISGATFATNGRLELAHLPDTIQSLEMRNLDSLSDFDATLNNLKLLTLEGGKQSTQAIVERTVDTLTTLYLYTIDWTDPGLSNTTLLNNLLGLFQSTITGSVYISGTSLQSEIDQYNEKWPDLVVSYNDSLHINQKRLRMFDDDSTTILKTVYINQGETIDTSVLVDPTKESSAQYDYTFKEWLDRDGKAMDFENYKMSADTDIFASYDHTLRQYTVRWYKDSKKTALLEMQTVDYGTTATYSGDLPSDTSQEGSFIYNLFNGWDTWTGFVTEDTDVCAKWLISNGLPLGGTDMSDMNIAQIYGIAQAGLIDNYFEVGDYFNLKVGEYAEYDGLPTCTDLLNGEEKVCSGKTFDVTQISPMATDSDWTLMAEVTFDTTSIDNSILISCYDVTTDDGFEIRYNSGPRVYWGSTSNVIGPTITKSTLIAASKNTVTNTAIEYFNSYRCVCVIRHAKGSNDISVTYFNSIGDTSTATTVTATISKSRSTITSNPIVFGGRRSSSGTATTIGSGYGVIHMCKFWDGYLDDTLVKNICSWPHETIKMLYFGKERYLLSDGTGTTKMSFISDSILQRSFSFGTSNTTSTGGYPKSTATAPLRAFFESYQHKIDPAVNSAIKTVICRSISSNGSTEIVGFNAKIFPPCYVELTGSSDTNYSEEGSAIPFITSKHACRLKSISNMKSFLNTAETSFSSGSSTISESILNYILSGEDGDVLHDTYGSYYSSGYYRYYHYIRVRNHWERTVYYITRTPLVGSSNYPYAYEIDPYGEVTSSYSFTNAYSVFIFSI